MSSSVPAFTVDPLGLIEEWFPALDLPEERQTVRPLERPRRGMLGAVQQAMNLIELRATRERIFGADLPASEPAWDMLLALFVAQAGANRPLPATVLCGACKAPTATALRWIKMLQQRGLIEQCPDRADRRRICIRLTDKGLDRMTELMASWGKD